MTVVGDAWERSMENCQVEWVNGCLSVTYTKLFRSTSVDAPSLDSPGYEQNPRELEIRAQYECPLPGTLQKR